MTTTGNRWDDDGPRPQRVRIRRPAPGGAGPWDGPDVPAPRPPAPAPGPHYAEAPYGPGAGHPYPPESGYPEGPAYPEDPAYGYPADPGPGCPYQGGAGHPYQPDAGGPDLSTSYLYVGRGDQGSPPPGYDPAVAAPLDDAALTPYSAIKGSADQLVPDATAWVSGVGGLGHMGVKFARAFGAHVVLFTTSPGKVEDGKKVRVSRASGKEI